jgi:hypothetical protein
MFNGWTGRGRDWDIWEVGLGEAEGTSRERARQRWVSLSSPTPKSHFPRPTLGVVMPAPGFSSSIRVASGGEAPCELPSSTSEFGCGEARMVQSDADALVPGLTDRGR